MPDLMVQIQETQEVITKRTEGRDRKVDQAHAILKTAAAADRNPTGEEKKLILGFEDEAKDDTDFITQLKSQKETLEGRASMIAATAAEFVGRQTDSDQLGTSARVIKERAEDDPMRGFKHPRDFILSVLEAGKKPDSAPPELLVPLRVEPERRTAGSDEQSRYNDPYGGFLVPEGMSPELMKLDPADDPMGAFTTRIPMTSPAIRVHYRVDKDHTSSVSGGLTVSRREESAAIATSRMQIARLRLEAHSLFGMAYVTEELLSDSPISFAALLSAGFSDEFAATIINERLNGTGVGEFQGVMNSPCLITISKETGQKAATLVLDNLVAMMARCWRYDNAIWLFNQTCIPQLTKLNQAIGTGGQIMWFQDARGDLPATLMGRPIVYTEYCKALGTLGDVVLGNWSQYLEGLYQPMRSAESIHVRFDRHERTFKFWLRNAGHCWWDTALTPKNGDTLSPFLTLAART